MSIQAETPPRIDVLRDSQIKALNDLNTSLKFLFSSPQAEGALNKAMIVSGENNEYWISSSIDDSGEKVVEMKLIQANGDEAVEVLPQTFEKTIRRMGKIDGVQVDCLDRVMLGVSRELTRLARVPETADLQYLLGLTATAHSWGIFARAHTNAELEVFRKDPRSTPEQIEQAEKDATQKMKEISDDERRYWKLVARVSELGEGAGGNTVDTQRTSQEEIALLEDQRKALETLVRTLKSPNRMKSQLVSEAVAEILPRGRHTEESIKALQHEARFADLTDADWEIIIQTINQTLRTSSQFMDEMHAALDRAIETGGKDIHAFSPKLGKQIQALVAAVRRDQKEHLNKIYFGNPAIKEMLTKLD